MYCQPLKDILPSPQACLVTGITPQVAMEKGLPESKFIERIHRELATPGTCGVGYNSIRFDDEVTRHTLYRNFYDPYQREWKNGNSRWDILDMLRLTRALRPDGIKWADNESGRPSFKLEHLTLANGIAHEEAHDALSDVTATIAMAKLVKRKQPRLFDYVVNHRSKRIVLEMLNLNQRKPFFHISGTFSNKSMYGAIMMPLARHPTNTNSIICIDLSSDPESLINMTSDEIRKQLFTPDRLLEDHSQRIRLAEVHVNKAPVVTTYKLIDSKIADRLKIDVEYCEHNWHRLNQYDFDAKLKAVYSGRDFSEKTEAEQRLYEGFIHKSDRPVLDEVRRATLVEFQQQGFHFSDERYNELLLSYRARYFYESLSIDERASWMESCRWRLYDENSGYLTLSGIYKEIDKLREAGDLSEGKNSVLHDLKRWADLVHDEFSQTN
jgi:exodeoxyribonuclease-1